MPRAPRLNIANGTYHVTNRGVERRVIVRDDHDRRQWLRLLDRAATRYGWRVFAYVLMDNHFHVYLRVDDMRKQFDAARCNEPPVTVESVVAAVSHSFEVTPAFVQRAGRHGNGAREAAVMLCRELVATNLDTLGTGFGGVSGSAVSEANRRACVRLQEDATFRERVDRARREIGT